MFGARQTSRGNRRVPFYPSQWEKTRAHHSNAKDNGASFSLSFHLSHLYPLCYDCFLSTAPCDHWAAIAASFFYKITVSVWVTWVHVEYNQMFHLTPHVFTICVVSSTVISQTGSILARKRQDGGREAEAKRERGLLFRGCTRQETPRCHCIVRRASASVRSMWAV